ncbi:hypothetical protein [Helicobacter cetorum]|uniref:Putative type II restriction endonuclease n=1 Tax=Helicobacter cetorum (strain ATCC BAA-540 / CCUG 52418 / MIT 99-5656) TaxID=1163745 RepID=I0ETJ0_HELCM|nr:hypothetical protein [Helicobacter cetorum]AFI06103.1 putative type II restriction endonuclease [Helicobacter cetorum MIT 99-5656]AFI06259.1 putative type II restriction endonuclease [Helicobacter cetorum MIT 99-5656]
MSDLRLHNQSFRILDTLEFIPLTDSFVKNKIGTGHGEAKLYVGNENERTYHFFGDFKKPLKCFFIKKDFLKYLKLAQNEFESPE